MADGPVVTRKVGAAKRAADAADGAVAEGAVTPAASADAASVGAGVTQPLAPAEGGAAAVSLPPEAPAEELEVIGAAAEVDAEAEPEEGAAPAPAPTPTRKSVAGARRASASAPAAETDADEEGDAKGDADPASGKKGKKRASKRRDRRQRRKEVKAAKRAQMTTTQRILRVVRTLLITVAVIAVIAVGAVAAGISYHRWYAYDDALDMQGTWYVSGTDTPIEITGDTIVLTDDVSYHYQLDPSSKTITFSFGGLSGQGHYRFSLDRQYLVIFDGTYSWEQSLSTDVSWLVRALLDYATESPNDLAQGAFYNVTLFSRSSAEDSSISAEVVTTPEGPRVVWSAADAEGSGDASSAGDGAGDGTAASDGSGDASGAGGSSNATSDVDSLLGNLSDR